MGFFASSYLGTAFDDQAATPDGPAPTEALILQRLAGLSPASARGLARRNAARRCAAFTLPFHPPSIEEIARQSAHGRTRS